MDRVPAFEAKGIIKNFGRIQALKGINFSIYPGEVVGILGDNGAGKSTLIKVFSGALAADEGEMLLEGELCHFTSPQEARDSGIETVYQDLALATDLDIESNLFLGREILKKGWREKFGFLDRKAMFAEVEELFTKLNIRVRDLSSNISDLSGGQRQAVAVARAVKWGNKLVIMDEPTAALGVEQSAMVLDLVRQVRSKGIPVIFISHTMPFVFDVCDRIVILRLGEVVADLNVKDTTVNEVVQYITGSLQSESIARLQQSSIRS
ncbi:ATP-binding cassette domain-containing protein [Paenibacillus sp. LMG 31456]|uniref:ATP-binding cassette domain-containing protein n=1 Tax=Paenibacillus foliorum TaxID=2654974 RepID=A0A972GYV3_9BACL|nr:ATP-binding cassette domain-containing protein [Paenibacillus foliorum]NOU97034.1 ATP-binding cassette domain-containing protein [Paenibacillus foliorum]